MFRSFSSVAVLYVVLKCDVMLCSYMVICKEGYTEALLSAWPAGESKSLRTTKMIIIHPVDVILKLEGQLDAALWIDS